MFVSQRKKNVCFHDFGRNKCFLWGCSNSHFFKFSCFFLLGGAPPGGIPWKCLPRVLTVIFNRQMCFANITFTLSTLRTILPMLMSWKIPCLLSNYHHSIQNGLPCFRCYIVVVRDAAAVSLGQKWVEKGTLALCSYLWEKKGPFSPFPQFFLLSFHFFLLLQTKWHLLEGLTGWENSRPWQCPVIGKA